MDQRVVSRLFKNKIKATSLRAFSREQKIEQLRLASLKVLNLTGLG